MPVPAGGLGGQSLHEDPEQGSGKGVSDDREGPCPSLGGLPGRGRVSRPPHGPAGPPRHAANSRPGLSVGGKRKRKSFSRSRTRANIARPCLPRLMLGHPPSSAPKGCQLPQSMPILPPTSPRGHSNRLITQTGGRLGNNVCPLHTHRGTAECLLGDTRVLPLGHWVG